jgi:hypothetical protein
MNGKVTYVDFGGTREVIPTEEAERRRRVVEANQPFADSVEPVTSEPDIEVENADDATGFSLDLHGGDFGAMLRGAVSTVLGIPEEFREIAAELNELLRGFDTLESKVHEHYLDFAAEGLTKKEAFILIENGREHWQVKPTYFLSLLEYAKAVE